VVFEAAWADHSVQTAVEIVRVGGRVVLVGIPGDDRLAMQHSTARRKGLDLRMARRMKHTYPRAIRLVTGGMIALDDLISHHFALAATPEAFALNAQYAPGVQKIIVEV
jgi:L-iditol 2-dehydrogenase